MTTGEVSAFANVSVRQLQWWDEQGLVHPSTNRPITHNREYTEEQAVTVRLISDLRRKGLSLHHIRFGLGGITIPLAGATIPLREGLLVIASTDMRSRFIVAESLEDAGQKILSMDAPAVLVEVKTV